MWFLFLIFNISNHIFHYPVRIILPPLQAKPLPFPMLNKSTSGGEIEMPLPKRAFVLAVILSLGDSRRKGAGGG